MKVEEKAIWDRMYTVVISGNVELRRDKYTAMKGWLEEYAAELLQSDKLWFLFVKRLLSSARVSFVFLKFLVRKLLYPGGFLPFKKQKVMENCNYIVLIVCSNQTYVCCKAGWIFSSFCCYKILFLHVSLTFACVQCPAPDTNLLCSLVCNTLPSVHYSFFVHEQE